MIQVDQVNQWAHFFKPEVRKQGEMVFAKGLVYLANTSDTGVQSLCKSGAPVRVKFASTSIASAACTAECACSAARRGQFCKHIWASLLQIESAFPDFLDSKSELNLKIPQAKETPATPQSEQRAAQAAERNEAQKAKQSEYRKAQYQQKKQKLKMDRKGGKDIGPAVDLPEDVAHALSYFVENGFTFEQPIAEAELNTAKRLLARIFHPDKGGSHAEMLTLQEHFDTLVQYARQ